MRINVKNEKKIWDAINKVQAKKRVRTMLYIHVKHYVQRIENRLFLLNVGKKEQRGMRFRIKPFAQKFPKAYNGIPEGTGFEIERGAKDWFVTRITRWSCNNVDKVYFINEEDYRKFFKF